MKLASEPLAPTKSSDSPKSASLFSYSYELRFPQPLSFESDLSCPGCGRYRILHRQPAHNHRQPAHNLSRLSSLLLITSLQPSQFHAITHSFAPRRTSIYPVLNSFRTLSIATGVVPARRGEYLNLYFNLGGTRRKLRIAGTPCFTASGTPRRSDTPQTCHPSPTMLKSTRHHYEHT